MKRHHLQRRRAMRAKAGGGGSLFSESFSPSPALQSYLGAALAMAFSSFGMSFASGAQAALFSGEPATFSINTLAVSTTGGTHSIPGTFTHYVAANGTGTWEQAESIDTPCSPETAFENAVGGNVVGFRAGTYNPTFSTNPNTYDTPAYNPTNSGTLGLPIIFQAYTGEVPTITGQVAGSYATYGTANLASIGVSPGHSYVIFDGFRVLHADTVAPAAPNETDAVYNTCQNIGIHYSSNIIVRNCELVGTINGRSSSGGNNALIYMDNPTSCEVYNCNLHSNTGGGSDGTGINTTGIWLFHAISCTIRNNNIHGNVNGISQKDPGNTLCEIYHNHLYDNTTMAFSLANQNTVTAVGQNIHDNLIRNSSVAFFLGNGNFPVQGYTIAHNTIHNCTYALQSAAGDEGYLDLDWHSNICSETGAFGVQLYGTQAIVRFDNNCYFRTGGFAWSRAYTEYYTIDDWREIIGDEENSITTTPLFVNAAGTTPADFDLQVGSACLTGGVDSTRRGVIDLSLVGIQ